MYNPIRLPILALIWLCLSTSAFAIKWDTNLLTLTPDLTKPYAEVLYHFHNDDDKPLKIAKVTSSCASCVSATFADKTYAPGESGEVTAHINLGDLSGIQHKYLTVTFADATLPPAQLTITINLPDFLLVEPKQLDWLTTDGDTPKTVKIQSLVADGKLEVISITPSGAVTATLAPAGTEPGHYLLTITPASKAKSGSIRLRLLAPGGTPIFQDVAFQRH